jgi:hypothetical protein
VAAPADAATRATREVAAPPPRTTAAPSAVEETFDVADDAPPRMDDESFENATPAELPRGDIAESTSMSAATNGRAEESATARPTPALDEIVQKLPPDTRRALDELFRARFTTVRRIRPEQLR